MVYGTSPVQEKEERSGLTFRIRWGDGKGPVSTLQLIHSVFSAVVSALSPGPRAQSRTFILRYILLLSLKGHGSDLYSESFRSRSCHCKRQKVNLQREVEDEGVVCVKCEVNSI